MHFPKHLEGKITGNEVASLQFWSGISRGDATNPEVAICLCMVYSESTQGIREETTKEPHLTDFPARVSIYVNWQICNEVIFYAISLVFGIGKRFF